MEGRRAAGEAFLRSHSPDHEDRRPKRKTSPWPRIFETPVADGSGMAGGPHSEALQHTVDRSVATRRLCTSQ